MKKIIKLYILFLLAYKYYNVENNRVPKVKISRKPTINIANTHYDMETFALDKALRKYMQYYQELYHGSVHLKGKFVRGEGNY